MLMFALVKVLLYRGETTVFREAQSPALPSVSRFASQVKVTPLFGTGVVDPAIGEGT